MPGDTPMSYPFPYKTSDGLLVDNSTGPVVIPEIKTDEIIITQGVVDAMSISTATTPSRGTIRTLDDAFGIDISVQGTGKSIRLMTDDIVRTTVEDLKVTVANALEVVGAITGTTATLTSTLTVAVIRGSGTTFIANDSLQMGLTTFDNFFIDRNFAGGNFIWGYNTPKVAGEHGIQQWYNNATDRNLLLTVVSKGSSTGTDRVQITCPLVSTLVTGTAPFTVTSTTVVPNLNVSQLLGGTWDIPGNIGSTTPATGSFTTLTATTLRGSTTTANANDTLLFGISTFDNCFIDRNFAGGNFIWGWNTGKITTEHFIQQWYNNSVDRNLLMSIVSKGSVSGTDRIQITCPLVSTLVTGTAPFTIASTTVVPNLNVSQLLGGTWAIPGTIGSTTPNTGNFTVTTTTSIRGTGTTFIANDTLMIGLTTFDNCFIDRNFAGGNFIWGWNTPKVAGEHAIQQFFNNATDRQALLSIVSKGTSSGTDRVSITCPLNLSNTLNILGNNTITMIGGSSGSVNIKPNTTGSTWDFILPSSAGTTGQVLTSGAGSTCTWTTISPASVHGTWTPAISILAGPSFGGGYSITTFGKFVKNDAAVTIGFFITINYGASVTSTSFKITGLPYSLGNNGAIGYFPAGWQIAPGGSIVSAGGTTVTPLWDIYPFTDINFNYYDNTGGPAAAYFKTNGTAGSFTIWGNTTYINNDF